MYSAWVCNRLCRKIMQSFTWAAVFTTVDVLGPWALSPPSLLKIHVFLNLWPSHHFPRANSENILHCQRGEPCNILEAPCSPSPGGDNTEGSALLGHIPSSGFLPTPRAQGCQLFPSSGWFPGPSGSSGVGKPKQGLHLSNLG